MRARTPLYENKQVTVTFFTGRARSCKSMAREVMLEFYLIVAQKKNLKDVLILRTAAAAVTAYILTCIVHASKQNLNVTASDPPLQCRHIAFLRLNINVFTI